MRPAGDAAHRIGGVPVPGSTGGRPLRSGSRTAPAGSRGAGSCELVTPISRSGPERRRPIPGQGTGLLWAFNVARKDFLTMDFAAVRAVHGVPGSSLPGRDLRLPREDHGPALRLPMTSGPPPGCADPQTHAENPKAMTASTTPLPKRQALPITAMPPKRHSRLSKSAHLTSWAWSWAHDGCREHYNVTDKAAQLRVSRFTG